MAATDTERLLTPIEVQEALRISRRTFFRLIRSGELPAVRIGKQLRVSPAELKNWIYSRDDA